MLRQVQQNWYLLPAIVMLIISQFDWPYGYYQILRVLVAFTALILTSIYYEAGRERWYLYAGIAVLFNPLIPIHLERAAWAVLDFITAAIFLRELLGKNPESNTANDDKSHSALDFSDSEYEKVKKALGGKREVTAEEVQDILRKGYVATGLVCERLIEEGVVTAVDDRHKLVERFTEEDLQQLLLEAEKVVVLHGKASSALLQRSLLIPYKIAAELIDRLEDKGVIGPPDGAKPREVIK